MRMFRYSKVDFTVRTNKRVLIRKSCKTLKRVSFSFSLLFKSTVWMRKVNMHSLIIFSIASALTAANMTFRWNKSIK
jgi:hypothetical protein